MMPSCGFVRATAKRRLDARRSQGEQDVLDKMKLDEGLIADSIKEFHPKAAVQTDEMKDLEGIRRMPSSSSSSTSR